MSGWTSIKLGDICDVRDGTHDSPKQNHIGKPLVTSKNLKNGSVSLENTYLISEGDFFQINRRSKVDKYDILFSMIGTVGEMAIVKEEPDFAIKNVGLFKCNGDYDLAKWIYYYMKSSAAKEELQAALKGSTQAYISLGDLRKFPMLQPPIEEQKTIASVLSSLDDKIDLLHRQNKTLEAMAETLFRQWFVEGVGEDWPEVKITDLFEVRDGTHDSPKPTPIGRPLITSKHILDGRLDIQGAYLISDDDFDKVNSRSQVHSSDILFSMIGTIGSIYFECSSEINYAIKNIGLFKTSQNKEWAIYTYLWLKSPSGRQYIDEHKSGSTQEYVSLGSLRNIVFQSPPQDLLKEFNQICQVYLDKINNNQLQIQLLEKLRDGLLPKLMSGEVRVA